MSHGPSSGEARAFNASSVVSTHASHIEVSTCSTHTGVRISDVCRTGPSVHATFKTCKESWEQTLRTQRFHDRTAPHSCQRPQRYLRMPPVRSCQDTSHEGRQQFPWHMFDGANQNFRNPWLEQLHGLRSLVPTSRMESCDALAVCVSRQLGTGTVSSKLPATCAELQTAAS